MCPYTLNRNLTTKETRVSSHALSRTGSSVYVAISTQFYSIVKELSNDIHVFPALPGFADILSRRDVAASSDARSL